MNNDSIKHSSTLSYRDLAVIIWRRKWLIVTVTLGVTLLSVIALQLSPRLYTAEMIIGPTATDGVAGRGTRLTLQTPETQMIRSAPVEIDKDESLSDFSRFIELLTSRETLSAVENNNELPVLRKLFSNQWNAQYGRWEPPTGVGARLRRAVEWLGRGGEVWHPPTVGTAAARLKHAIRIEPVGTSAMRRVLYRHEDPDFAVSLLNSLYQQTDNHLRKRAKKRTQAEISYIKRALEQVSLAEHRRALADLLAAQEQTQMMINVGLPFAADQIEAAHAPKIPDWPPVIPVVITALLSGLLISVVTVYMLETEPGS